MAKLAEVGDPTTEYGPPVVAERSTSYDVAPATAAQLRSISEVDTAVATTLPGTPIAVVAETWLEMAEVSEEAVACTT